MGTNKLPKNNIVKIEKSIEKYLKKMFPAAIIIKEYGRTGTESRPDYAVFLKDKLIFIELKGNKDTFTRLDRQVHFYTRLADQLIVVLDKKHNRNRAIALTKKGVGIIFFDQDKPKKKRLNFDLSFSRYDPFSVTDILNLLYSQELKLFLNRIDTPQTRLTSLNDRFLAIKAVFSQFEIKKLSYNILFNRISSWNKSGRPDTGYGYGSLTMKIEFLESKRLMYANFIIDHCTTFNNRNIVENISGTPF